MIIIVTSGNYSDYHLDCVLQRDAEVTEDERVAMRKRCKEVDEQSRVEYEAWCNEVRKIDIARVPAPYVHRNAISKLMQEEGRSETDAELAIIAAEEERNKSVKYPTTPLDADERWRDALISEFGFQPIDYQEFHDGP